MKYAIIKVANGNFSILAENANLQSIKISFFDACKTLWNEPSVITGKLRIVDENFDPIEGGKYTEYITHPAS